MRRPQQEERFDELGLSLDPELRERQATVYYCHNPPVNVETITRGSTRASKTS